MWYENDEQPVKLDYTKPIIADDGNEKFLLIPIIQKNENKIVGYNWLCLTDGCYTYCKIYQSAQQAMDANRVIFKFRNVDFTRI